MKKRSLGNALRAAVLLGTVLLGACVGDGADILTVPATANGGTLFTRYVALGNSITAGYQSGGINDSLQQRAYPVLLAQRAGATNFTYPSINNPGCPRPFLAPLGTTGRVGTADRCSRANNPRILNNVAVPGERILDLLRFPTSVNLGKLHTLMVGERTQLRAMIESDPTFVSVWIGNNDALEASVSGVLGPQAAGADSTLTTLAAFQSRLNSVVDSIKLAAPQGAMLIGVVNAVRAAPIIQPGAYFYLARDPATNRFNGKLVNANCSPVTALGAPNPLAANFVSFQIVADANFPEINCDPAAYPAGSPYLLTVQEATIVSQRVAQFNAAIEAAATANNWLYVDPNTILEGFRANKEAATGRYQFLRKCQDLATAATAAQFQAAVLNSCPVTGATAAPNFFGSLISFDGVHPSTSAHRILAGRFAAAIN
ncbi:MAG TPA: SGNH/GDSL hydrolase family protein, partial [Longimicrobium sp.]|nr:SGNH/GDSL hydrolase family protein [Longimicrobium sp.]